MHKFLTELGEGLSWIWMTPDAARRLLDIGDRGANATTDSSFEARPARLAA